MKSPSLSFRTTSRRGAAPRAVEVAVIRAPEPRDTEGVSLVAQGPAYLSLPRLGRTGNVSVTDYTRPGEPGLPAPCLGPARLPGRAELPRAGRRTADAGLAGAGAARGGARAALPEGPGRRGDPLPQP